MYNPRALLVINQSHPLAVSLLRMFAKGRAQSRFTPLILNFHIQHNTPRRKRVIQRQTQNIFLSSKQSCHNPQAFPTEVVKHTIRFGTSLIHF